MVWKFKVCLRKIDHSQNCNCCALDWVIVKFMVSDNSHWRKVGIVCSSQNFLMLFCSRTVIVTVTVLIADTFSFPSCLCHCWSQNNMLCFQVDCPFIVCMTYAFHTTDKLCFILDLMNGGDLHYHLSQHGVFNEHEMKFYAAEVILGESSITQYIVTCIIIF